jgi:hypothetical protein
MDHGYFHLSMDITKDLPEKDYEPRVIRGSINRGQQVNRIGSNLHSSVKRVTELGAVFVIHAFSQIDVSTCRLTLNRPEGF